MPFAYRSRRTRARPVATTTTAPRAGLFSRRRRAAPRTTVPRTRASPAKRSHVRTAAPVHHQKRRPSMKDKVSGALLRLKGSLTHRPAVKVRIPPLRTPEYIAAHLTMQQAAGTRRMHGTDGRGSRRRRFL